MPKTAVKPAAAKTAGRRRPKKLAEAQGASTRVVLLTAAQDDTDFYEADLVNLQAYAAHRGAEIRMGGFTYQKGLFEDHRVASGVFRKELVPYLSPEVVQLAPRLIWYGKANILPTAADPLTGWDTQTKSPFEKLLKAVCGHDSSLGCGPQRRAAEWPRSRRKPSGIPAT